MPVSDNVWAIEVANPTKQTLIGVSPPSTFISSGSKFWPTCSSYQYMSSSF